jgi:hypothetical protein
MKKMGVEGWRKTAKDRDTGQFIVKKARVLHGQ